MKALRFLREPGYIYDLFSLFVLHFNKDICLTDYINSKKSVEDTEYFNCLYEEHKDITPDLLPFFYLKSGAKCFMSRYYFKKYKSTFTTTYQLSLVQEALTHFDEVVENMLEFYFPEVDESMRLICRHSMVETGRLIKNSTYSDAVKSSLYAFFLEPAPIIQKLIYALMDKSFYLSRQYEQAVKQLEQLQNSLDREELTEKFRACKDVGFDIEPFSEVYVSFCLAHKNCVYALYNQEEAIVLLGGDYSDNLDDLSSQENKIDLNALGTAFSEKNRTDILEMLIEKGEVTIRDVEEQLGFTGANSYYHLSLMIKAGVIKTRNRGRTVLYSLNESFFRAVADAMNGYADKVKRGGAS